MIPDPQAKRGVPEDGPASKDENYSSGKGKDKEIKSESTHQEGEGSERTVKVNDASAPRIVMLQLDPGFNRPRCQSPNKGHDV